MAINSATRRHMIALSRRDEDRLKRILSSTRGRGGAGLDKLGTDDLCILFCHFQSFKAAADHCGLSVSGTKDAFYRNGVSLDSVLRWVEDNISNILTAENIDLGEVAMVDPSELERALAMVEYYKRRYEYEKAKNQKLSNGYNLYRDIIATTVTEFPAVPAAYQNPTSDYKNDEELCFLPISDTQIGSCVLPERLGGLAHYNWDVFLHRIEEYKRGVNSIVNEHLRLSYPINTAVVMLLGDLIENEVTFPNQMAHIDLDLTSQIFNGALQIAELIRWLAAQFKHVRVLAIPGNHGNVKGTTMNADYIAYIMMAQALAAQPNVEFMVSETYYLGFYIDKNQDYLDFKGHDRVWNFLMTHGHQAKSYNSLPFYSLERLVRRYSSMTGILWDKLFVGHHHQDVPGPRNAWAINGSWVGGTEYSQEKMQGNDQPCQRIWGFHPKRGLTWTYSIDLDKEMRLEMRANDNGVYTPVTTVSIDEKGATKFNLAAGGFSTE